MTKEEKIIEIMNVLGDEGRNEMIKGLLAQFYEMAIAKDPDIDQDLLKRSLDRFGDDVPRVIKETEKDVAAIYSRHLSDAEVDNLSEFYRSASGISIMKKMPALQLEAHLVYATAASAAFDSILSEELARGTPADEDPKKEWN